MDNTVSQEVVKESAAKWAAKKKKAEQVISSSGRLKCYDMQIGKKLEKLVSVCPLVEFTVDSESTSWFWFWKRREITFTLKGPRVDVSFCMDKIEEYMLNMKLQTLGM
jgi:hypothetical protein